MRFLSIRADAFGPFPANETLQLTPGLNIVHGPNEAGKSSWHAALYVGLCGVRRGQGPLSGDDRMFSERHRPWGNDADPWVVTMILELKDGRRLELRHDLAARTATVADPATGRPFLGDLITEGSPDGSRLLGLDRRAFTATACVGQTELLRIRQSSSRLQEYLGKAVATGRDDETVVGAMTAINDYYDSYVGTDRAPTRPWRRAVDSVARLTRELQEAERAHEAHLALIARGEDARAEAEDGRHLLDLVLASQAARGAELLGKRFQRAAQLQPFFAAGPPSTALGDDELASSVAVALASWDNQPEEPGLTGATAEQLRVKLEALPQMPKGDLQPHVSVQTAGERVRNAAAALEQHAISLIAQGEDLNTEADAARQQIDIVLAEQVGSDAARLRERLQRASELRASTSREPSQDALGDHELASSVAVALASWDNQPEEPGLTGATAEQLRVQLEALPQMPKGDLQPHVSVQTAGERVRNAAAALEQHAALEPAMGEQSESGGLSEVELRQLAFDLRQGTGETAGQVSPTQTETNGAWIKPHGWLVVGGGLVAALGFFLLLAWPLVGAPLLVVGLSVSAWALMADRQAEGTTVAKHGARIEAQMLAEASKRVRQAAEVRAKEAGLRPDSDVLQGLAAAKVRQAERDAWARHHSELRGLLASCEHELREALNARGIEPTSDLAAYEVACRERQLIATEAGQRPGLQAQLEARQAAEKAAAEASTLRRQARRGLVDTCERCGIAEGEPVQIVEALRTWMQQRSLRLAELDERRLAAAKVRQAERDAWARHHSELRGLLARYEHELREALNARGIEPTSDQAADLAAYEVACRERQLIATEAGQRPGLQAQLEARQAAEKAAAEASTLRRQAHQVVFDASVKCNVHESEPAQMVEALKGWVEQRSLRLEELDNQRSRWTELSQLLDGGSLHELDVATQDSRGAADALARNLSADELDATSLEPDVNAQVERLRQTYHTLAQTAAESQGQIGTESGRVPSVPLAEEELAAAQAELDRVARLRDTLNKTKQYLEVAQDRVNHDIAPVLNELVGRRLSQITDGRYSEVRVDPEDLNVRVRLPNGTLQSAHLLSGGTAEQVFLLLRVAMAERLTKPDEVCPLILDDVTDQSDGGRTKSILETLLAISAERQVILFSQEGDVLSWAEASLQDGARGQLVRLNQLTASA